MTNTTKTRAELAEEIKRLIKVVFEEGEDWCNWRRDDEASMAAETLVDQLAATPEQRWIPVTERLPKHGEQCLLFNKPVTTTFQVLKGYVRFGFYDSKTQHWDVGSGQISSGWISHWMPLPEGPDQSVGANKMMVEE